MGEWSEWSQCISKGAKTTCGDGLRKRKRKIVQKETPGGKTCEHRIEEEPCFKCCPGNITNETIILTLFITIYKWIAIK